MQELSHLLHCPLIRSVAGDKGLLLYRVLHNIVIINRNSDLPFMFAAVHISDYCKYCVPVSIHFQQLDFMLLGQIPYIRILCYSKAEYEGYLICILVIIPQFIGLYK